MSDLDTNDTPARLILVEIQISEATAERLRQLWPGRSLSEAASRTLTFEPPAPRMPAPRMVREFEPFRELLESASPAQRGLWFDLYGEACLRFAAGGAGHRFGFLGADDGLQSLLLNLGHGPDVKGLDEMIEEGWLMAVNSTSGANYYFLGNFYEWNFGEAVPIEDVAQFCASLEGITE